MRLQVAALLLSLFSASPCLSGQAVDLATNRVPISELTGPWRFHTGDDPAWSNPAFDDSGWSLVRADKGWSARGYSGYSGVAWYRLVAAVPAQHGPLAIYIPNVDVSCQVFANGRLIGQKGSLPPHPHWTTQARMVYPIPDDAVRGSRLLLAVRVWLDPPSQTRIPAVSIPLPASATRRPSSNGAVSRIVRHFGRTRCPSSSSSPTRSGSRLLLPVRVAPDGARVSLVRHLSSRLGGFECREPLRRIPSPSVLHVAPL